MIQRSGLLHTLNMLNHIYRILQLRNLKKSIYKGPRISKPSPSPPMPKIIHIEEILFLCTNTLNGLQVLKVTVIVVIGPYSACSVEDKIITFLSSNQFWKSWRRIGNSTHHYTVKKEHFDVIHGALIPCVSSPVPKSKWMWFSEMGYLIASAYNKVCYRSDKIWFLGDIFSTSEWSTSRSIRTHHVYWVSFKIATLCWSLHEIGVSYIPSTLLEWTEHSRKEAETWPDYSGKDERVHQIERAWKRIKYGKVEWGTNDRFRQWYIFLYILDCNQCTFFECIIANDVISIWFNTKVIYIQKWWCKCRLLLFTNFMIYIFCLCLHSFWFVSGFWVILDTHIQIHPILNLKL